MATASPVIAEPALTVIEPLRVRTTNGEPLVFLVYATEGTAKSVKVTVTELKDPETKALSPTGSLDAKTRENDAGSTWVTVTPTGNEWDRFGDYLATLRIEAEGVKTPLIKAATFTRVKPDVTIVGFKDKNVTLTRPWPWCTTSRDVNLTLLNKGTAPVREVSLGVEPVTDNGGSLSVIPPKKSAQPGMTPLRLHIQDVDKTGTLPAKLLVSFPGQAAVEEVPFNLVVSDSWPAPVLAIFTGVLLALIVNLLANRLKPIQESRYRGLRLRQQVMNLRLTTGEHKAEIGSILNDLADVDLRNQAGLDAEAKPKLDAIEKKIGDLQKTIDDERQVVDRFAAVRVQLESLGERAASLKPRADELQRLLDNRLYQAATAQLTELKTAISALPPPERRARPEEEETAPAPPAAIVVTTPAKEVRAGKAIAFEVRGAAGNVTWSFDDGSDSEVGGTQVVHTFVEAGRYTVTARVENGPTLTAVVNVDPSALQSELTATRRSLWASEILLSLIALVIAVTTGIWLLYAGKTFGSAAQYCEAILWGVGIDSSVRGLGNVMKKLTSNG